VIETGSTRAEAGNTRVEIIRANPLHLADKINAWLEDNPTMQVLSISYSAADRAQSAALIWYIP
jgi:hypothetical protein